MNQNPSLTRREFAAAISAITVASIAPPVTLAAMQTTSTQPTTTRPSRSDPATQLATPLDWLEQRLGRSIPPELRQLVAERMRENDDMWARSRAFAVPDGTEPATLFQPLAKK